MCPVFAHLQPYSPCVYAHNIEISADKPTIIWAYSGRQPAICPTRSAAGSLLCNSIPLAYQLPLASLHFYRSLYQYRHGLMSANLVPSPLWFSHIRDSWNHELQKPHQSLQIVTYSASDWWRGIFRMTWRSVLPNCWIHNYG